jgi:hypothetical protein
MKKAAETKKVTSGKALGIRHTFDRNGVLVVNPHALLSNTSFVCQMRAAAELGRYKARVDPKKA